MVLIIHDARWACVRRISTAEVISVELAEPHWLVAHGSADAVHVYGVHARAEAAHSRVPGEPARESRLSIPCGQDHDSPSSSSAPQVSGSRSASGVGRSVGLRWWPFVVLLYNDDED